MGSKGSKGKAGGKGTSSPAPSSPKIVLPPKKVKKDSPYDLTYFIFLGGIVVEEYIELQRDNSSMKIMTQDKLEPPKPLSQMSEEERKAFELESEKHEKKVAMQKLMEKNLQQKIKHGEKPISPPVPGGLLGKAKKKMQQTQEKIAHKAEEATKPTESLEDRVKRQAMAGAQGTLTGGATAALGQDIAKSQAMRDLEKKRKEFAKQEEHKKKLEEEERKKLEAEKKKNQPKGLADFLSKQDVVVTSPLQQEQRQSQGPAARLNAFLSSAEASPIATSSPPASSPAEEEHQEEEIPPNNSKLTSFLSDAESPMTVTASEDQERVQSNRLGKFLAAQEEGTTRPKSEGRFAGFLGATVKRLSFKPAETTTLVQDDDAEEKVDAMPTVGETEEQVANNKQEEEEIPVKEEEEIPVKEPVVVEVPAKEAIEEDNNTVDVQEVSLPAADEVAVEGGE